MPYDYERDGDLKIGETLLIYSDGRRVRVSSNKLSKLERREYGEPRESANRRDIFRGRTSLVTKHKQENTRRTSIKKRLPLHKVKPEQ